MTSKFDRINAKFSFDARSLLVFRISLGILLFSHLLKIYLIFPTFFSNQGVLRQDQVVFPIHKFSFPLFFWLDDSPLGQWVVGLAVIISILVIVGKWTKLSLFFLWVVLNSLNSRNPLAHHAGDGWLHLTVFLSIFLPIDQVFALNSTSQNFSDQKVTSSVGVLIFSQLVCVYFFAGLSKLNPLWLQGYGVSLAFNYVVYDKPLAQWLFAGPTWILKSLNWFVLFTELFISHLLWLGGKFWKLRMAAICILMGFHLACFMTLILDIFPWIGIINLSLLIPSDFWNLLSRRNQSTLPKINYTPKWRKIAFLGTIYPLFLSLFILNGVCVLYPQLGKNMLLRNLKQFEQFIGLGQNWFLFTGYTTSPSDIAHLNQAGIFYVSGKRLNGTEIYLNDDKPQIGHNKPITTDFSQQDYIWHKYFDGMRKFNRQRKLISKNLASYYCKKYDNKNDPDSLKSVKIEFMDVAEKKTLESKEISWETQLTPIVEINCDTLTQG